MSDEYDEHLRRAALLYRDSIIEECAKVADKYGCGPAVIEAIRALKSNTGG